MVFLGFNLSSENMLVTPTQKKIDKTLDFIDSILKSNPHKIRTIASLVGILNDLVKGVDYSAAHVKGIEREKNFALKNAGKLQFEGYMVLGPMACNDLKWWQQNLQSSCRKIRINTPTIEVFTDASREGWGGVSGENSINGRWEQHELQLHINVLEMMAVFYTLKGLFNATENVHFKVLCDNTTAVTYLNKGGGTWSDNCNVVSRLIWDWCQVRGNWISLTHIPGSLNKEADFASRNFTDDSEWGLNKLIFKAM